LSQHVKGVHGKKKEFATKTELKEAAIKKKPKETLEQEEGRLTILDQIEQLCASAGKSLTTGIEFQELESETTATSFSATESVQEMESGTNTTSFSATESDLYLESLGPLQD
jgi:DNA repair ATPase RecN